MRFRFVSDFISVMELKKENAMKSTRRIVAAGLAVATMFGTPWLGRMRQQQR